jgi:hypothetical protein
MSCGCVLIYYGIVLARDKSDKSYKMSNYGIWALSEVATGLLVACLPVFPMFLGVLGKTATVSKIGTLIRGLLRQSTGSGGSGSYKNRTYGIGKNEVPTIGQARVKQPGLRLEEIEFETLIEMNNN